MGGGGFCIYFVDRYRGKVCQKVLFRLRYY